HYPYDSVLPDLHTGEAHPSIGMLDCLTSANQLPRPSREPCPEVTLIMVCPFVGSSIGDPAASRIPVKDIGTPCAVRGDARPISCACTWGSLLLPELPHSAMRSPAFTSLPTFTF